ncbi:universal stress protein [Flammeovirgaceae bacterium SG7u.111]|nr:universal stress protein [Flammeovirgaceae bacterium SG7u.132]WPO36616.1 universal stress protein [Flammeovirgaceae bacterium SG7u.111]
METKDNFLISVDFSKQDYSLIEAASLMTEIYKPSKFQLINVKGKNIPSSILMEELVRIEKDFDSKAEFDFDVLEGDPKTEIYNKSIQDKPKLVIVGKKQANSNESRIAEYLTEKGASDVLVVPPTPKFNIDTVLFTGDFSRHSEVAFQRAVRIARKKGAALIFMHVYDVPAGHTRLNISYRQFARTMKQHAENRLKIFLKKNHTKGVKIIPHLVEKGNSSKANLILRESKKLGADMIVVGARGRTNMAHLVLGSTTKGLVKGNEYAYVLAVKSQGTPMSLMDAISHI